MELGSNHKLNRDKERIAKAILFKGFNSHVYTLTFYWRCCLKITTMKKKNKTFAQATAPVKSNVKVLQAMLMYVNL